MNSIVTLSNAAKYLDLSESEVLLAIERGELEAKRTGELWKVSLASLESWAKNERLHDRLGDEAVVCLPETQSLNTQLLDRLEQSQRKAVFFEMQLQQTQHLLSERNEEQHQREARALEAEAKAKVVEQQLGSEQELRRQAEKEAAHLKSELASLKTEMSVQKRNWDKARRPWYQKLFKKSV